MFKSTVYVAPIPEDIEIEEVYPPERQAEIERCSKFSVRAEKYYAWSVLEYAVGQCLGKRMDEVGFRKTDYGKWLCDCCFFSISHSNGVVAVAVSSENIGVDIEAVRRCHSGMESRILTDKERDILYCREVGKAEEYIIEKWSQKESIFKTLECRVFEPSKIETDDFSVISRPIKLKGERFILSVCTEDKESLEFNITK